MIEAGTHLSDILPSGLCEDAQGETTALIQRIASRNRQALSRLHSLWSPAFLGIALRILGDPREAADAVHHGFIRIWRNAPDYNPHHTPPVVWAISLLRDECLRKLPKSPPEHPATHPHGATAGTGPDTSHTLSTDDRHRLRNALEQLPPEELGALELAVFLEFAHGREAASHANGSLKTLLRSALERLRTRLSCHEL